MAIVDINKHFARKAQEQALEMAKQLCVVKVLEPRIGEKKALFLKNHWNIETMGDLSGTHVTALHNIPGFGVKTLQAIDKALVEMGLDVLDRGKEDLSDELFYRYLELLTPLEALALARKQGLNLSDEAIASTGLDPCNLPENIPLPP